MRDREISKGKEFVEDKFIAESLYDEDKLARTQIAGKYLQQLQNEVSDAYIKLLSAQSVYEVAMKKLEAEEARQKSSAAIIHSSLGLRPRAMEEKKDLPIAKSAIAPQEMLKVEAHFDKIPAHLKSLMEAVIGDNIILGLARDPVFIRGGGIVYDRSTVEGWLKGKESAPIPHNPGKLFTRADIISCNTIIEAMADLMKIINGKEAEMKAPLALNKLSYTETSLSLKRVRIPLEMISAIEEAYNHFPDKHKVLFNKICRDPITNVIMDDPVFLPDGHIYDRSTVFAALNNRSSARCPLNKDIQFTLADVTDCYCVRNALDELRKGFEMLKSGPAAKSLSRSC